MSENASISSADPHHNSLSSSTDTGRHDTTSRSDESLAREETKAVNRSKRLLIAFIFLAAVGSGIGTYFLLRNAEEDDFETQVCVKCIDRWNLFISLSGRNGFLILF